MAAPHGNRFWEARSTHGRKPIFSDPEQLWDACCQYFQWVEDNPLWEVKSYMYQGQPVQDKIPKMRAMTKEGLCIFLDISVRCWDAYCQRDDFIPVTTRVMDIIRTQKLTGAAADQLNANIIARDLGLKDQTSNELMGKDGGPIQTTNLDLSNLDEEELETIERILSSAQSRGHSGGEGKA